MKGVFALAILFGGLSAVQADPLPTFRIGVLNDQSGLYADIAGPGSVEAARMAVEDFKPDVRGFRVEVLSADHQNKPDIGAAIVRRWFDVDQVDAIVDVPTSSVALAVSNIASEKDKAFLIASAGSSDLTGKNCTRTNVHWTYDTWALGNSTARAVIKQGGKSWYFLTTDYAFGHALERDATEAVTKAGGKSLGHVLAPFQSTDFSSYLLQAHGSGAQVVALANSGGDTINAIKQASEFGLTDGGQKLVALLAFISDIHSVGLKVAHGLTLTEAFYWDLNDGTRTWAKRFAARNGGRYPTMNQAGTYAAMLHWMKAIAALDKDKAHRGTDIVAQMKAMPTNDPLFGHGSIRADGRTIHDLYLFQVKDPSESKGPYDYYKLVDTIPGDQAFRPMADGGCPLVAHTAAK
ncbi:amino acid/amide ABC transporter substrate-binding protein, HAAT family [Methylobacterium sp. 190mf]|uniref:ABC transporter substrate-binding protein n=1 Tax=Methylobacterium sp. 190mf TaxID=1761798 RepID=UPI00089F6AD6|nr:ABC transporter substrate-binding protein [Methylobacterium sp. 190mf]SEG45046.1 amino acid/amide ABC transporter substrate-binding protein, HAAT family [Methylobacterium sp. 190mf]